MGIWANISNQGTECEKQISLGNSGGVAAGSISVNRVGSGNNITSSMTAIAFENLKFIYVQVHNEDASNDESYLNASDIDGAFEGQIGITYFTT